MQSQIQTTYEELARGVDLKDMEINIGVVTPLTSPYNLFLNVKQISDPESELVYFYVYSFGKKKVILWGVYVKNTEEFIIEGGCKYAVKNLNKYLKEWKKRDYSYIGNSVYNRVNTVISKELGVKLWDYDEYLRYKFILAYYEDRISEFELQKRYLNEPYIFLDEVYEKYNLNELIDDEREISQAIDSEMLSLKDQIRKFEININRTDLNREIMRSLPSEIKERIKYITELFYKAIRFGYYTEGIYYANLEDCPDLEKCVENYNGAGCEVVHYGDEELGMLSSKDLSVLL